MKDQARKKVIYREININTKELKNINYVCWFLTIHHFL